MLLVSSNWLSFRLSPEIERKGNEKWYLVRDRDKEHGGKRIDSENGERREERGRVN